MQALTANEAMDWLPRAGIVCDANGDLAIGNGKNRVIAVPLPDKAYRLPYLANLLVTGIGDTPFGESLLWFTGWGVAGEVSNRVGFKLLQSMHADTRPLIEAPARLLGAHEMVEAVPAAYVATMTKAKRNGKIFIDFFRNDYTATAIADYAVRARPGAPVALPLSWNELDDLESGSQFTMKDVLARLKRRKPPLPPRPQRLPRS